MNEGQNMEATASEQNNPLQQSIAEHNNDNIAPPPVPKEQSAANEQNQTTAETSNQHTIDKPPMEVHHPHHPSHKKKWSEYVLEFLMLFLAVFLGFIAENVRETSVERHREKEYILNMVQNLKDDAAQLSLRIPGLRLMLQKFDSLAHLTKADLTVPQNLKTVTRLAFEYGASYYPFMSNNATMVQLKSGNLRLIQTSHAADSILKYDYMTALTAKQQEQYLLIYNEYIPTAEQVFDLTQLLDTTYVRNFKVTGVLPPPVTTNKETLKLYFNKVAAYVISARGHLRNLEGQASYAKRLIDYLKNQYHLKDE